MNHKIILGIGSLTAVCLMVAEPAKELRLSDIAGKTDLKIGFIDSFSAMRESKEGKEAGKELEAKRDVLAKDIQQLEQKITQAMNDFKVKSPTLSADARDRKESELKKMRKDFEDKVQESEEDMKLSMQRTTERLAKEIEEAVIIVAAEQNLDAVVDAMTGRVLYAKPNALYTTSIIDNMNKKYDTKLAQAKPADSAKLAQAKPAPKPAAPKAA